MTVTVTAVLTFHVVTDDTLEQPRKTSDAIDNAARAVEIKSRTGVTLVGTEMRSSTPSA